MPTGATRRDAKAATIKSECATAGMNYRTVLRAGDALNVVREKNPFSGVWQWRFRKPGQAGDKMRVTDSKSAENLSSCHLDENQWKIEDFDPANPLGDKLNHPVTLEQKPAEDAGECAIAARMR